MEKIAVLTSGGDSQGMNAFVYKLVNLLEKNKYEVVGIEEGYNGIFERKFVNLTSKSIEPFSLLGGSFLKTARSARFSTQEGLLEASKILKEENIACLVINGGNGSFKGANELSELGINVICVPGTIDNDVYFSDLSLGFDTAVNNAVDYIDKVKQTMKANNRGVVFEVMGRNCGNIALNTALSVNADSLIVNEDKNSISSVFKNVETAIKNGETSPVIILQENILDANGLIEELEKKFKKDFRFIDVGYVQRGGEPTVKDRIFATSLACKTFELIKNKTYNQAVGQKLEKIFNMPLNKALDVHDNFNYDLYNLYLND